MILTVVVVEASPGQYCVPGTEKIVFPSVTCFLSRGTLFFPVADLEGSLLVQWTSSGTSFLPAKSSAAPRGGLRSAVRLGSCGGVLGQQTLPWCVGRVTAQWMRHLSQPIF